MCTKNNLKSEHTFKLVVLIAAGLLSFILSSSPLFAAVDNTLYYTGTPISANSYYLDAYAGNPDVTFGICGVGQRYVGGFYAANVSGTITSVLVSYSTPTASLAFTSSVLGSGCYQAPAGLITVSPSYLRSLSPAVYRAALPGRLWLGHAASANPTNVTTFLVSNLTQLVGNYSINRSYNYTTGFLTVQEPTIVFGNASANFTKSFTDQNYGVNATRPAVFAFCSDDLGTTCSYATTLNSSIFPYDLQTNLNFSTNDQTTLSRFIVINGIGQPVCLGANFVIDDVEVADTLYQNDTTTAYVTLRNALNSPTEEYGGNIPVTSSFDINTFLSNQSDVTSRSSVSARLYTDDVGINETIELPINITISNATGDYTLIFQVNYGSLVQECSIADNYYYLNISLRERVSLRTYIDGTLTTNFTRANVPYTVRFAFADATGSPIPNATIYLNETNGLSLQTGIQISNISHNSTNITYAGTQVMHSTKLVTDYTGNVTFTYVPTYNPLYATEYEYLGIDDYIGNYSLTVSGYTQEGNRMLFNTSSGNSYEFNLSITNPFSTATVSATSIESNATVAIVYDSIYKTFINFLRSIG